MDESSLKYIGKDENGNIVVKKHMLFLNELIRHPLSIISFGMLFFGGYVSIALLYGVSPIIKVIVCVIWFILLLKLYIWMFTRNIINAYTKIVSNTGEDTEGCTSICK